MNLQMIQFCLQVQAQEGHEASQNDVLDGLAQLRQEIEHLKKLSQRRKRNGTDSVPATVLQSLTVAVALDENASTTMNETRSDILSVSTQQPSEKTQLWMQNQRSLNEATGREVHRNRSDDIRQPPLGLDGPSHQHTEVIKPVEAEMRWIEDLQMSRRLLSSGRIEPAKSLCRKVIHETESIGINYPSYKEAVEILAHIYEYTGDKEEATQVQMLLDMSGRISIRKDLKSLIRQRDLRRCLSYTYKWAVLLCDNAALQTYSPYLAGLPMHGDFSNAAIFVAICITGNTLLAQTMLSQGVSTHEMASARINGEIRALTPFGCAIHFGHSHLMHTLMEAASEDPDTFIKARHLEFAIDSWNVDMCRILLDHILSLYKGNVMRQMDFKVASSSTESEKIQVGALLERKSAGSNGSGGCWNALLSALNKAISQKDQAMTKLLLSYGIRNPDILQLITRMNWLEGVQAAATQANHVSEEDVAYAFQSRNLDICNYLLSLNPKCATSVINYAMEGAGIEGLQMVIKFGANVNHPVYWSSAKRMGPLYPLHFAVHIGSSEMVKTLLAAGADVRNQDEVGQTALQFAIKKGQRKDLPEKGIVALLKGMEPRKTNNGATTSSYSKGSSLRSWWSSSKRHQVAATVGN
ncbi:hypothetical protein VI817_010131 [Penicillium citrinum]|nr:hypothetical protein VI817_010131 [Penicillium citrinum]